MTPYELVGRYVEPHLRAIVASKLAKAGLSQGKIAKLLSVTQPMVRRYTSAGPDVAFGKLEEAGLERDEAEAITSVLADILARDDPWGYRRTLIHILTSLLSREVFCSLHKRLDPQIPADCNLCHSLFSSSSDLYVEDVRNAFMILQSSSKAYMLVPEVGMNIVSAPLTARTPGEVVGFLGRIVRVGSRIIAAGEPVYGGSRHTAMVLLLAKSRWDEIRAAIAVRYGEEYLEKVDGPVVFSGPHGDRSDLLVDLKMSLAEQQERPAALVDLGSTGVEPVIYIFSMRATKAAEKALRLLVQ